VGACGSRRPREAPGSGTTWLTGNVAATAGGGIFVDLFWTSSPVEVHGRLRATPRETSPAAGPDAQFLAQVGNIVADPQYVPGEFRLQAGSPAVDAGLDAVAGATDLDGAPRIQTAMATAWPSWDLGAFERSTDFDEDGIPDWIDRTTTTMASPIPADCADPRSLRADPAPRGRGAHRRRLGTRRSSRGCRWEADLHYDVIGGSLLALHLPDAPQAVCLANDLAASGWSDVGPDPSPRDGFYYLVRAQRCLRGELWHRELRRRSAASPTCP
jgi:hypothetical protein